MKIKILSVLLLVCLLMSIASCGKKITMDDIDDRIRNLEESWLEHVERFDSDDKWGWRYEIREQLELEGYGVDGFDGAVMSGYELDDQTFVFEFQSASEAKKASSALCYWENEWRYDEFVMVRKNNIVILGEKHIVEMIIDD